MRASSCTKPEPQHPEECYIACACASGSGCERRGAQFLLPTYMGSIFLHLSLRSAHILFARHGYGNAARMKT
jgi:hypothetical protein